MKYNLSNRVKELCSQRGIQLKDLAKAMGIAPESLSRAINGNPQLSTITCIADNLGIGNPQLSTITCIADNLGISISELFAVKEQIPLNAIIVCKNKTYTAQSLSELKLYVNEIENEYTHLE